VVLTRILFLFTVCNIIVLSAGVGGAVREKSGCACVDLLRSPVLLGDISRSAGMISDCIRGFLPINARTLSGVTRRTGAGERRRIRTAGSLRIETFEGSRPRLRRTRQVWVLNHPGSLGRGFSGNGESANVSLPTRGRRRKVQCKFPESGFCVAFGLSRGFEHTSTAPAGASGFLRR
jgi:hypothetical protein